MKIGTATIEKGDNQFIKHIHHEIEVRGEPIGNITITLFNITEAIERSTAWRWICREREYLFPYRGYLFDMRNKVCALSPLLSTASNENGCVLIIDTIALDPEIKTHLQELEAILHILLMYENDFISFMLPDWNVLANQLSISTMELKKNLEIIGFTQCDDFIATGFRQDMLFANDDMFDDFEDLTTT
ncbi:hypothetical protein [Vibrio owensii]|uniref:hypothetical protein n=1 Tax=Vibrio harveyi group TaxID=717610 RepID=UPI003CC5940F